MNYKPGVSWTTCRLFLYFTCLCLALHVFNSCKSRSHQNKVQLIDSTLIQIPQPTPISTAEKQLLQEACEKWYDSVLKNSGFNGGILVARNGNIVFEKYKGTAHLKGTDTINAETVFHIASVSKTFTASAILKLWEQGKLEIDSTFDHYYPSFNYPGVTIRSLLNHRSGLPNYLYFMEDLGWDKRNFLSNQDLLDTMIARKADIKNIGQPNKRFNYCNTNYALLALVVEMVSGQSFPVFMDSAFFRPLQMKNSFVYTHADSGRTTPSYDWRGVKIPNDFLDEIYGDKNIYSTVNDLLTWDRALSKTPFLKPNTLQQAYQPYSNEKPGIKNYGLGWRMNVYNPERKIIFHNGWWHGNNSVFIRLIQEDATIIVLGNRYTNSIYKAKNLSNIFVNYTIDDESE